MVTLTKLLNETVGTAIQGDTWHIETERITTLIYNFHIICVK